MGKVITVGVGDSLQALLEVGDGEVLHRLLATLGSFEHSLSCSFHYAVSVPLLFSIKMIDIFSPQGKGLDGLS